MTAGRKLRKRHAAGTKVQPYSRLTDAERPRANWHKSDNFLAEIVPGDVTQGSRPSSTSAQWVNVRAGTDAIAGTLGTACHQRDAGCPISTEQTIPSVKNTGEFY